MSGNRNKIVEVLMRRDGLSEEEALEILADGRRSVEQGEDPEEVLYQEFGLEPDYIFDLIEV